MELTFLIPSKIRRLVLAYFVAEPEANVYVRELARELEVAPQQVYRELINLENWGFLFSSKRGNQRVFRLNKRFPFYEPVCDLFNRLEIENNRTFTVSKTYDLYEHVERVKKIPIPEEMIPGLKAKRRKPRAYEEEKMLERLKKKRILDIINLKYLKEFAREEDYLETLREVMRA